MGLVLAIENSNPSAAPGAPGPGPGVALGRLGPTGLDVLGQERLREAGRHNDDLVPAIDRLVRRVGARPGDIAEVAVSVGPGGYTALRIAVAAAKMIADTAGARCVAVPSALVVAHRHLASAGRACVPFAVALAGKESGPYGGTAWVAVFTDPGADAAGAAAGGRVMGPQALPTLGVELLIADAFLPAAMQAAAAAAGIRVVPPIFDPVACLEVAVALPLPRIDPVDLLPIYPRQPEAISLWHSRGKR